jgi:cytoplasmic iron level regulating protein YaaA (DUF328/UPF0246 family)
MHLSSNLSNLNWERYQQWSTNITTANAKQCLLAFKGDVYAGLNAETFNEEDFDFAQQHLRILSRLYGLLKPLDLMMPYRLEMGTRLENKRGKNLYQFWGNIITDALNEQLKQQGDDVLINLASNEYFKSVKPKLIEGQIITPQFKEMKNGEYKMIGIYAKKARGLLSRFIIKNRLSAPEDLKHFTLDDYRFRDEMSDEKQWVFTRG